MRAKADQKDKKKATLCWVRFSAKYIRNYFNKMAILKRFRAANNGKLYIIPTCIIKRYFLIDD